MKGLFILHLILSFWKNNPKKFYEVKNDFYRYFKPNIYTEGHIVVHTSYSLLNNTLDGLSSQIWEGQGQAL